FTFAGGRPTRWLPGGKRSSRLYGESYRMSLHTAGRPGPRPAPAPDRPRKPPHVRYFRQFARSPSGAARRGLLAAPGRPLHAADPRLAALPRPARSGGRRPRAGGPGGGGATTARLPPARADGFLPPLAAHHHGELRPRLLAGAARPAAGPGRQRL